MSKLATSEIAIFEVVSVAEQAGLGMAFLETQRQVFSRRGPCSNALATVTSVSHK